MKIDKLRESIENIWNKREKLSKSVSKKDLNIINETIKSLDKGIVRVELQGACSGCPSSIMTLKQGVQNLLKHYVKEVNSVEAI